MDSMGGSIGTEMSPILRRYKNGKKGMGENAEPEWC